MTCNILLYAFNMQLGWQLDEEGSVIMPEPLFTSRVLCFLQAPLSLQAYLADASPLVSDLLPCGVQADREQLTQLMFEEFNMTGFFLCDQPILSLYAVGKITGTVVDIGHAKTGKVSLTCTLCDIICGSNHYDHDHVTCISVMLSQHIVSPQSHHLLSTRQARNISYLFDCSVLVHLA